MRTVLLGALTLFTSLTGSLAAAAGEPAASGASKTTGIAVVELYTSEGCSSCPPADEVLAEIGRDSAFKDKSVYLLAFHVDYWDYIGWKDPFASHEATKRQRSYGRNFAANSIYTPQSIVNGDDEFVGSNAGATRTAIARELAKPAAATVELKAAAVASEPRSYDVIVTRTGGPDRVDLLVAITENGLSSTVKRGENGGRVLNHEHVVRAFATASAKDREPTVLRIKLPEGVNADKAQIIGLVQAPEHGRILGAADAKLPKAPAK